MARQDEDTAYYLDGVFQDPDADLVLGSGPSTMVEPDVPVSVRIQCAKLAAISPVFEGMFEVGTVDGSMEETMYGLPFVKLPESTPVIRILQAAAYNRAELLNLRKLNRSLNLEIWEAASKYEMFVVRSLASMAIS